MESNGWVMWNMGTFNDPCAKWRLFVAYLHHRTQVLPKKPAVEINFMQGTGVFDSFAMTIVVQTGSFEYPLVMTNITMENHHAING